MRNADGPKRATIHSEPTMINQKKFAFKATGRRHKSPARRTRRAQAQSQQSREPSAVTSKPTAPSRRCGCGFVGAGTHRPLAHHWAAGSRIIRVCACWRRAPTPERGHFLFCFIISAVNVVTRASSPTVDTREVHVLRGCKRCSVCHLLTPDAISSLSQNPVLSMLPWWNHARNGANIIGESVFKS